MEYTVQKLSEIANVSTRTLRYYDEIGILKPARINGFKQKIIDDEVAELHKRWVCFYWPTYSKEAHAGVAQMYVDDERFTAYYDKEVLQVQRNF
jgi:hypothetical protein